MVKTPTLSVHSIILIPLLDNAAERVLLLTSLRDLHVSRTTCISSGQLEF